jgi:putative cell wall-binding protein
VVVGGTSAIDDQAFASLAGYAPQGATQRVAGLDRYDTSRQVAARFFGESMPRVYLATGLGFADAIAAGAAAAHVGAPVVLVPGTSAHLDTATHDLMVSSATTSITIVGGTAAVSSGIASDLQALPRVAVTRVSGADRYETAAQLDAQTFEIKSDTGFLAVGTNYPDALAGGAYAASIGAPVFLSMQTCIPSDVMWEIMRLSIGHITLLGGTSTLSDAVAGFAIC